MHTSLNNVDSEDEVMKAFRVFDKNGAGFVSAAELRGILTSLGEKLIEEEVDELFKEGEIDSNGFINYGDICQAVIQ
jgi:calmodulin